jgi:hypothetical protein
LSIGNTRDAGEGTCQKEKNDMSMSEIAGQISSHFGIDGETIDAIIAFDGKIKFSGVLSEFEPSKCDSIGFPLLLEVTKHLTAKEDVGENLIPFCDFLASVFIDGDLVLDQFMQTEICSFLEEKLHSSCGTPKQIKSVLVGIAAVHGRSRDFCQTLRSW